MMYNKVNFKQGDQITRSQANVRVLKKKGIIRKLSLVIDCY